MDTRTTREREFFLMYSGIVAFQFHPGNNFRLTPKECLVEAYRYMAAYEAKGTEELWHG